MFFWGWSVFSNQQHLNNNKSELASITRYHNKSHSNPTDDDDQDNNIPKQNRSSQNVLLPIEPSPHPDEDGEPLMASPSSLATTTNRKPLITISSPLSGTDDDDEPIKFTIARSPSHFIPENRFVSFAAASVLPHMPSQLGIIPFGLHLIIILFRFLSSPLSGRVSCRSPAPSQ